MGAKRLLPLTCSLFFICLALSQQHETEKKKPATREDRPQQQSLPQHQKPLFLAGRVIYDDGSPAQDPAQVEMVCNGVIRRQVRIQNGDFSLEVGSKKGRMSVMDASVGSPGMGYVTSGAELFESRVRNRQIEQGSQVDLNQVDLNGCELRASQAGFQSETIQLSFRRPLDNPDVGVIVLYRVGNRLGTMTSVNTELAPKNARKAYQKAQKELRGQDPDYARAAAELDGAVKTYPEFAAAWELLGRVKLALQDPTSARKAFESAIRSDRHFILPYMSLIDLEVEHERWERVSEWASQVTQLDPYNMRAHYYKAVSEYYLGRAESAEESFRKVRGSHRAPDYPYTFYILGLLLAQKGDFTAATTELLHYLEIQPDAPEAEPIRLQVREWEQDGRIDSLPPQP